MTNPTVTSHTKNKLFNISFKSKIQDFPQIPEGLISSVAQVF